MRFGSWALAEVMRRLGVHGVDLYRLQIGDQVLPVVTVADFSAIGGAPLPRMFGHNALVAAVPAALGVLAFESDSAFRIKIRNNGGSGIQVHCLPKPMAAGVAGPVPFGTSYIEPNSQTGPQTRCGVGSIAGPFNFPLEAVGAGGSEGFEWSVSPDRVFYVVGTIVNTILILSAQITELVAVENQV